MPRMFRAPSLISALALGALTIGCGASKDGSGSTGSETGTETCSPTGEIPCYEGKAEPCEGFHTDYLGDEYCLKPPDNGWQIHVGPSDYDNPEDVSKWILPAGAGDVNWCYQMKAPNEETVYTNQYYSHMRPGSHHYILLGLPSPVDDSTEPGSCAARTSGFVGGGGFLSGATRLVQDAAMFGNAPEDQGLAYESPPHQQLSVNLHFVNITDEPRLQEIWVNQIYFPEGQPITNKIRAITWLGGLGMNIAPGEHVVVPGGGQSCQPPEDVRILGVTAHMHASTTRVSMYMQRAGETERSLVFEDYNWEEPTVFRFNSTTQNEAPDPVAARPGALVNGVLNAHPGDQFSWECEVTNNRGVNLTFSDKAYDGEMCNVFGMYAAPDPQSPWACFDLRGGTPL